MSRRPKRRGASEGTIYKQEKKLTLRTGLSSKLVTGMGKSISARYRITIRTGSRRSRSRLSASPGSCMKKCGTRWMRPSGPAEGYLNKPTSKETVEQFLERWLRDSVNFRSSRKPSGLMKA